MPVYETISEQRQQLLTEGFTLLPGALPSDLLARWRDLGERLEVNAIEAYARNESLHGTCVIEDPVGPRLMRYDDILGEDGDAVLDLLACPAMMSDWLQTLKPGTDPQQQDLHALGSIAVGGQAGDMIIWHHALPHGSRPNLGRRPRIVQYINMHPGRPKVV